MSKRKEINIMTSCDDNIAIYILPQLASINMHLGMYRIDFYLMHSSITDEHIKLLRDFTATLDNIRFHEIKVCDNGLFDKSVKYGDARSQGRRLWPHETYYWYYAHKYLPAEMERVMYIDAGDVVIVGDVGEYYFKDFNDKLFIASPRLMISRNGKPDVFNKYDTADLETLRTMLSLGTFCAGVLVLNLNKFRETISESFIDDFIELLKNTFPGADCLYLGDQGLASAAFTGEIEFFGGEDGVDISYRPYNFPVGYYYDHEEGDISYTPKVLHYNASYTCKPWVARFGADEVGKYNFRVEKQFKYAPFVANAPIIKLNEEWWKCCKETPVFEELDYRARIAAKALQDHFFPLCKSFNELASNHHDLTQRHNSLTKNYQDLLNESPLLAHLTPPDASFLHSVIAAVLRGDMQAALDDVLRLAEGEIPDEQAERFLILAVNICASVEYADGWIVFQKELIGLLIGSDRKYEALEKIKELEELLPDDAEIKEYRKEAESL